MDTYKAFYNLQNHFIYFLTSMLFIIPILQMRKCRLSEAKHKFTKLIHPLHPSHLARVPSPCLTWLPILLTVLQVHPARAASWPVPTPHTPLCVGLMALYCNVTTHLSVHYPGPTPSTEHGSFQALSSGFFREDVGNLEKNTEGQEHLWINHGFP